jgi:hypothetical protein
MSYNSVEVHGVDQNQANQQAAGKLSIFGGKGKVRNGGLFGFYFSSPKRTPLSCRFFPIFVLPSGNSRLPMGGVFAFSSCS